MIKELLNTVNYVLCAELALGLFFAVFVAVSIKTLLTDRRTVQRWANIVLNDSQETPADERQPK